MGILISGTTNDILVNGISVATDAEVSSAVAPLATKVDSSSFTGTNQSLSANGYQKMPGGLIIQWGTTTAVSAASGTSTTVTLPTPFITGCMMAIASNTGVVASNSSYNTTAKSTTSFTVQRANSGNTDTGATFNWFAIGI